MRLVKYFSYSSLVSFVQYGYVFDPTYPRGCRAPVPHAPSSATIALQLPGEQELTHISQFKIRTTILGALNRNIFLIKCSKTVRKIHSYSNDIAMYFFLRTTAFEHAPIRQ